MHYSALHSLAQTSNTESDRQAERDTDTWTDIHRQTDSGGQCHIGDIQIET